MHKKSSVESLASKMYKKYSCKIKTSHIIQSDCRYWAFPRNYENCVTSQYPAILRCSCESETSVCRRRCCERQRPRIPEGGFGNDGEGGVGCRTTKAWHRRSADTRPGLSLHKSCCVSRVTPQVMLCISCHSTGHIIGTQPHHKSCCTSSVTL